MTDPTYDPVLASRLRAYAEGGVRTINVLEIAEGAIADRRARRSARPALTLLAAAFLVVGAAVAALVVGSSRVPQPLTGSVVFGYVDHGQRSAWRVDLPAGRATALVRVRAGTAVSPDGGHTAWVETHPGRSDEVHIGDTISRQDVVVQAGGIVWATWDPTTEIGPCYGCVNATFTWSPDGRWVAWASCAHPSTCAFVVSATDGSSRRVLGPAFPETEVDHQAYLLWRPDDRLLVHLPGLGFQEADSDGQHLRAVGRLPGDSPDGRWIIVVDSDLTITGLDGTPRSRVTLGGEQVTDVAWAPDSSMLAVSLSSSDDPGATRAGNLGLLDLDGNYARADLLADAASGTATWSPDSSRLFVVDRPVFEGGAIVAAEGAIVARDGRLIESFRDASIGVWSADGGHLAVAGPASHRVSILDADGSNRMEIGLPTAARVDQLVWLR
ncbi:MAG: hypothetical protein ACJ76W_06375 [Chloroflexota bacterium]